MERSYSWLTLDYTSPIHTIEIKGEIYMSEFRICKYNEFYIWGIPPM